MSKKKKKHEPLASVLSFPKKTTCAARDCKEKIYKFSFCKEHFQEFKFGLINKNGEDVKDYERKREQYQNYLESLKKAA